MKDVVLAKCSLIADKEAIAAGTPSLTLMERAAEGLYSAHTWEGATAIVCGVGNNGGDGYALAYILSSNGKHVDVFAIDSPLTDDALFYFRECERCGVKIRPYIAGCLNGFDTVVDCIFGVGLNRPVEGNVADIIREINDSGAYVIAADIPSGLFADNGTSGECVNAALTVTFGALKCGHVLNDGIDRCGKVTFHDIGTTPVPVAHIMEREDLSSIFTPRKRNSNKGSYGYVSLIAGCEKYSGAAKLANLAASSMRSGAGVVRLCVGRSLINSVSPYILESTLYPMSEKDGYLAFNEAELNEALEGTSAVAIGMGMGHGDETDELVEYVIRTYEGNLILDADALNAVSRIGCDILRESKGRVVITPHPGEFSRMCGISVGSILADPIVVAQDFARNYGVIVLLKGCTTVVTDGERVYLCDKGCAGQATAGSGDVLSGVLCGLLGYSCDVLLSTVAGAYICGEAACRAQEVVGEYSLLASDTVARLPEVIRDMQILEQYSKDEI